MANKRQRKYEIERPDGLKVRKGRGSERYQGRTIKPKKGDGAYTRKNWRQEQQDD